ncbi:hypothetical protein [Segetibacter aerophilus]|uniref:Uncharacterized protein n=1 Tax=Segetibacter aerophilus TaxID=670293 RepID=A0A512B9U4_9BACT|nr:hypothetical protein [Segetibacter aerophilus]GEO08736.1 hypothetical protein SAE01_12320 [Segetibacter aerophilus]
MQVDNERQQDEPDHFGNFAEKDGLYTVRVSRLNPPFLTIIYDHLSKSGSLIEGDPIPPDVKPMLDKAVRWGMHNVRFDDFEIESFKKNSIIQEQFQAFKTTLGPPGPKNKKKRDFRWYMNRIPVYL